MVRLAVMALLGCGGTEPPGSASTWYLDSDGDGFGDPAVPRSAATAPPDHTADGTDCDDGDPTHHPGAAEVCDGADDDCDGRIDLDDSDVTDAVELPTDSDGDGHGDPADAVRSCGGVPLPADDCDDAAPAVHPGADEVRDAIDNDCDGWIDEVGPIASAAHAVVQDTDDIGLSTLRTLGDLDGDGDDELAFSRAILAGSPVRLGSLDTSAATWTVPYTSDDASHFALPVGDTDGDGRHELVVTNGTPTIGLWEWSPAVGSEIRLEDTSVRFDPGEGLTVVTVAGGDGDGNGLADLVVTTWTGERTAAIDWYADVSTRAGTSTRADAAASIVVDDGTDLPGFELVADHDLDGDGLHDLVLQVEGDDGESDDPYHESGAVHVFLGTPTWADRPLADADARWYDTPAYAGLGATPITVVDVDGDGVVDVTAASETGVYVVSGSRAGGGAGRIAEVAQAHVDTRRGRSAGVADLNGDGRPDLAAGTCDDAYSPCGVVLFDGGTLAAGGQIAVGAAVGRWTMETDADAPDFVSSVGDLDADGLLELAVVGDREDEGRALYLWYGGP